MSGIRTRTIVTPRGSELFRSPIYPAIAIDKACEPDELPSQKPTAVVAFAIAAPTVRLSRAGSLKKNDTTSAPVNCRRRSRQR